MELITATECVNKLRQAGAFKGKLPYFISLVNQGWIPHHEKPGSSKRWYMYSEAKAALKDMEDPTRDAQREANERKRKPEPIKEDAIPQQIMAILEKIKHVEDFKPAAFDRSQLDNEDVETFSCNIAAINEVNGTIRDLTFPLLGLLNDLSGGNFKSSKAELKLVEFLERWIMDRDTIRDFYGVG